MNLTQTLQNLLKKDLPLEEQVELLSSLNRFEVTGELLFEAANLLMQEAIYLSPESMNVADIVGTGGDGKGFFNISTTAAFIAAGAGVPILKSGNVGISGRSGSMDCLQALNVKLPKTADEALAQLEENGLSFIFAPYFYPSVAKLKPARKVLAERGEKSIFNLLGPLVNPFRPRVQVLGVYQESLLQPYAKAMRFLGREGFVIHCEGSDELLLSENLQILKVTKAEILPFALNLYALGLQKPESFAELEGGDPIQNAAITLQILENGDSGAKRDVACLNAMMALLAFEPSLNVQQAWKRVNEALTQGKALNQLRNVQGEG